MEGKESYEEDESKTAFCMCIFGFFGAVGSMRFESRCSGNRSCPRGRRKAGAAETAAGNSKTAGNATAAGVTIAAGDSITAGEASADGEEDLTEMPEEGMRTVQTDKGPVEIPVNPQVIVSDYYLGEFLAVDVKPVIASPYSLSNPFLKGMVEGIQELNTVSAETSLEMIVAKEPDLIVTITEADYEKYAAIAPTVYIQDGSRSDEELFYYIAGLVGKENEAEAYIADFRKRTEAAGEEIREIVGNRTVSIVEVWPQQIYTMGSHFARGGSILYDIWKLKAPSAVQAEMVDADTPYKVVSLEALPEYTGDFILYGVLADTDSSFVEESRLWNSLDAVKAGRVLAYEQVAFMHRDPITLNAQLDIFVDFFRSVGEKE